MINAAAAAGLNFLSSGIQAYGQYKSGKQAQSAYDQNAGIYEQQVEAVRVKQALEDYKAKKAAASVIGSQGAAYAASGVNPFTGSPIDVMVDSLSNAYLDMAINKYNNELAGARYQSEADMARYTGKQIARESKLKAGLTLLQGAASYGLKNSKLGQK